MELTLVTILIVFAGVFSDLFHEGRRSRSAWLPEDIGSSCPVCAAMARLASFRRRRSAPANRRKFARLIWRLTSPKGAFDDATFGRSAATLDDPDRVQIVIHTSR